MTYKYDLKSISQQTGLSNSYIRRVIRASKYFVDKYSIKGNNNKLLFDSNALQIFIEMGKKKEEGYTLNKALEQVEQTLTNRVKSIDKPRQNQEQSQSNYQDEMLINKYIQEVEQTKKLFEQVVTLKSELSQSQNKLEDVENTVKLLADGRSPREVLKEQLEYSSKIELMEKDLQTEKKQLIKSKEIENNLTKKINTQEQELIEVRSQVEKTKKIQSLYKELSTLGIFSGKRKKEVQNEIKILESTVH